MDVWLLVLLTLQLELNPESDSEPMVSPYLYEISSFETEKECWIAANVFQLMMVPKPEVVAYSINCKYGGKLI